LRPIPYRFGLSNRFGVVALFAKPCGFAGFREKLKTDQNKTGKPSYIWLEFAIPPGGGIQGQPAFFTYPERSVIQQYTQSLVSFSVQAGLTLACRLGLPSAGFAEWFFDEGSDDPHHATWRVPPPRQRAAGPLSRGGSAMATECLTGTGIG
jgi:hypothetical protein